MSIVRTDICIIGAGAAGLSVAAGALSPGLAGALTDGLSLLSQLSGNPNTLDIPLGFRGGRVMLGPVPIGPAPVVRLR